MERCYLHKTYSLGSLEVRNCPLCKQATDDAREAAHQEALRRQSEEDEDSPIINAIETAVIAEAVTEIFTPDTSIPDPPAADPTPSSDFSGAFDGGASGGGGADGGW